MKPFLRKLCRFLFVEPPKRPAYSILCAVIFLLAFIFLPESTTRFSRIGWLQMVVIFLVSLGFNGFFTFLNARKAPGKRRFHCLRLSNAAWMGSTSIPYCFFFRPGALDSAIALVLFALGSGLGYHFCLRLRRS